MDSKDSYCTPEPPIRHVPQLRGISASAGIDLKEQIFLPSLPPCCAQSALPYWAKITGTLVSTSPRDRLVTVTVTLLDGRGCSLEVCTDIVAVDAGQESAFEIKLKEFRDRTAAYTMSLEEGDPYASEEPL